MEYIQYCILKFFNMKDESHLNKLLIFSIPEDESNDLEKLTNFIMLFQFNKELKFDFKASHNQSDNYSQVQQIIVEKVSQYLKSLDILKLKVDEVQQIDSNQH